MATFVSDSDIKAELASIHRLLDPAKAPGHWATIIANANTTAYREILRVLAGRGYTPTQIADWDDAEDFNRNIAVCHAMRKLGLPEGQESLSLSNICKVREDLKTADFTIDGVVVDPAGPRGGFSTGSFDITNDATTMDTIL